MNLYEGLKAPFNGDSKIYSIYSTDNDVKLSTIPAMKLTDMNGTNCYRLPAPYFVSALSSTEVLHNEHINHLLTLNYGRVIYMTDQKDAEEYAAEILDNKIKYKRAEIKQLQEDIKNLSLINSHF